MNWKKPGANQHPPFKKIVLGMKFPDMVELVKLDRIDETGPVFVSARKGLLTEMVNMIFTTNNAPDMKIDIDMYCEFELPEDKKDK